MISRQKFTSVKKFGQKSSCFETLRKSSPHQAGRHRPLRFACLSKFQTFSNLFLQRNLNLTASAKFKLFQTFSCKYLWICLPEHNSKWKDLIMQITLNRMNIQLNQSEEIFNLILHWKLFNFVIITCHRNQSLNDWMVFKSGWNRALYSIQHLPFWECSLFYENSFWVFPVVILLVEQLQHLLMRFYLKSHHW